MMVVVLLAVLLLVVIVVRIAKEQTVALTVRFDEYDAEGIDNVHGFDGQCVCGGMRWF